VKENEVGVGIMGANLRVRRRAKVFREEIESEAKERHLTRPSNVFAIVLCEPDSSTEEESTGNLVG
jgi:hypothetical protein